MKKILILFVLAFLFVFSPQETFAQKIKKPQAKTDPTLRPNKKSQKKKDKFLKKKKKRGAIMRPSDFHALYMRRTEEQDSSYSS